MNKIKHKGKIIKIDNQEISVVITRGDMCHHCAAKAKCQLMQEQTQIIKQQSIKEFIRNKYISLSKRMGLLLFLYIPITYNCFMYINELIYKLKK